MEEAEALCTKMGIMVRGGIFKCFGSSTHIKNKFATGYEIEIKIKRTTFEDLTEFAGEIGLEKSLKGRINLDEAIAKVRGSNYEEIILE